MIPEELAAVRGRLEGFAAEMFAPLARADQRAKGVAYLRGLLTDGRCKSMPPMGERLGVDHQGLQQFVSAWTWDPAAVRERLAARAVDTIGPRAWVVDDTGFPKDGRASPGVARQYSGSLGKVANCQIGVAVHAVTDAASCPLDWRLFLPDSWDDACVPDGPDEQTELREAVAARRRRAGIPEEERHRPKWRLALDMLDELAGWGLVPPGVAADAGYGNNGEFRAGLAERGWSYLVQVDNDLTAHPGDAVPNLVPSSGRGPRPKPRYRSKPVGLREHALAAEGHACQPVVWWQGSRGALASVFLALRVRPAGRRATARQGADGSLPEGWLRAEWPPGPPEPTDY